MFAHNKFISWLKEIKIEEIDCDEFYTSQWNVIICIIA